MSKALWLKAHELAVEEAMDKGLTWDEAYKSDECAKRADIICADQVADMIDRARDLAKERQT